MIRLKQEMIIKKIIVVLIIYVRVLIILEEVLELNL